ncbi:hypothetical protein GVAV_002006 [Gurleya vavrai]
MAKKSEILSYSKNIPDFKSNNENKKANSHLAHSKNLTTSPKITIIEDVILKKDMISEKSVSTDPNVSINPKEINQKYDAYNNSSSILKKTSPDSVTRSETDEEEAIITISNFKSTPLKLKGDIYPFYNENSTSDIKKIELQIKIPFYQNKALENGKESVIKALSYTKKEKIKKNEEQNLKLFATIEHQKQLKAKSFSKQIVQQQNNEQITKEPSTSHIKKRHFFGKFQNTIQNLDKLDELPNKAIQDHENLFDTKNFINKHVEFDPIKLEDVRKNESLIIGQTNTQNVFFTKNKNFVYKNDNKYSILYSEDNSIFKTSNEEFFFLTKFKNIVLMSQDLKEKLQIISKNFKAIKNYENLQYDIISIEYDIQNIFDQINDNQKKRKRIIEANFNRHAKCIKVSNTIENKILDQKESQNKNLNFLQESITVGNVKQESSSKISKEENAINMVDNLNDQRLSLYINPLYNKDKLNLQKILSSKPLVQPFVDFKDDKKATNWHFKYVNFNVKKELKTYIDSKISKTSIKILELENDFIFEQNKYLISFYKELFQNAKIGNKTDKLLFKKTTLASLLFKNEFEKNNKIKISINNDVFKIFSVDITENWQDNVFKENQEILNKKFFWKNDISNDFFKIKDHFFDAFVVENFNFSLYVKDIFRLVFSTDANFEEKITLVENFDFHAQNIIITGKLNFFSFLKLVDSCTIKFNDQESNLYYFGLRKKVFEVFKPGTPGIDYVFRELIFFEDYINYTKYNNLSFYNSFGVLHVTFFFIYF